MEASSAGDIESEYSTAPRIGDRLGSRGPLTTTTPVRLSLEFQRSDHPSSASLAAWAYLVLGGTMQHSLLLEGESRTLFYSRSSRTLPRATPTHRHLTTISVLLT